MLIHPSAVIDGGAQLGAGTQVSHFSRVCAGARVGIDCTIGQGVFIGDQVLIGSRVRIDNNVSLQDAVTLEDSVFCGSSVVFTNVFNPRATTSAAPEVRRTLIRQGATLGANSTVVCGITVGRHAFVGAGAVVSRDVPDFALVVGVPARQIGWVSRQGEPLNLPLKGQAEASCPMTGESYVLREGVCGPASEITA